MTDGFWAFSLAFYDAPEARSACLTLQDDHGADVNVALYLLWRAARGDAFAVEEVSAIDAAVAGWRAYTVQPLRALRRRLKEASLLEPDAQDGFRTKIKTVELDAEKLEQATLEQLQITASGVGAPQDSARKSLGAYATYLGSDIPPSLIEVFVARLAVVI